MRRYYFISDDLNDLESIEQELEENGITTPQIHVLSEDDAGVKSHHLNYVPSFMKKDVVHSAAVAAMFGFLCAVLILCVTQYTGVTETTGWTPFVLLAVIVMGFITWEGGMWGIQEPNIHFKRFERVLAEGKHVLYVDINRKQKTVLQSVIGGHDKLLNAGIEDCSQGLLIGAENQAHRFAKWGP